MKFRYAGREFDLEGADREDYIYRFIEVTRGFYEMELLEYIRFVTQLHRREDPVYIDIGANIGNHSVFFGALLGGHTISIEPNPRVLPILRRNLEHNVPSYSVYDCAVGAVEGTGTLITPASGPMNLGNARVEVNSGPTSAGGVTIATLDSVLADYRCARGRGGRVALMKIDVEGAEVTVLRGATQVLRAEMPHVFVEAATPEQDRALSTFLKPLGYEPVTRWGWRATPVVHFAYRPSGWLRLGARAFQLASVPPFVVRALRRRVSTGWFR